MSAAYRPRAPSYAWVTDEMFYDKVEAIVSRMSTDAILAVPGVYELLSEELNNEVLEELEVEHGRAEDGDDVGDES